MASIPSGIDKLHMPSEAAPPTKVDEARQQASTTPGDGRVVHDSPVEEDHLASDMRHSTTETATKVPFKEKVIGYAQKARGTILRKPRTLYMGWFSNKPELEEPPSKQERQKCWESRDGYFSCLDKTGVVKAGDEKGACSGEKNKYEQNCAKSWIDYFNQRRVIAEAQKERLAQASKR